MKEKLPGATDEENRMLEPEPTWLFILYGSLVMFFGLFAALEAFMGK